MYDLSVLLPTLLKVMIVIIIVIVFLECLSMWNMLNYAEQVQIPKYKTHNQNSTCVQTIMLKHPTKQWRGAKNTK